MEQREKVARAIAKATIGDDVAINREGFSRQHYYEVADAVLLALGLGEGGENVIVPKEPTEAMVEAFYDGATEARDASLDEQKRLQKFPYGVAPSEWFPDAYRAMISARPQAGEAGE